MKVEIEQRRQDSSMAVARFSMTQIPREGDYVEVVDGPMGEVKKVIWILGPGSEQKAIVRLNWES